MDAALAYAARGWPVLALVPRGKKPLTRHGHQDATMDPDRIRSWWTRWPEANVGIVTGTRSGLLVLDQDGPEGDAALIELGAAVPTLTSRTAKGKHLYFKHAPGIGCRARLRSGIDVRGDGGYVVAPPSVHESGVVYRWDDAHWMGWETNPAPLPERLHWALRERVSESTAPIGLLVEGTRNVNLTELAGSVAARANHRKEVLEEVLAFNRARCSPPLPERDVLAIVRSIWRRECRSRAQGRKARGGLAGPDVLIKIRSSALDVHEADDLGRLGYLFDLARLIAGKAEMPIPTGRGNSRPAYVADGTAEIANRYLENRWGKTYKTVRGMLERWEVQGVIETLSPRPGRTNRLIRLREGCGISAEARADLLSARGADLLDHVTSVRERGSRHQVGSRGADLPAGPRAASTSSSRGSSGGSRQAGPGLERDHPVFINDEPVFLDESANAAGLLPEGPAPEILPHVPVPPGSATVPLEILPGSACEELVAWASAGGRSQRDGRVPAGRQRGRDPLQALPRTPEAAALKAEVRAHRRAQREGP